MRDVIYTPLALPQIEDKQTILDRFDAPETFVWWGEETLLGEKATNNPLGYPQAWTARARQLYPQIVDWVETHVPCDELYYIRIARARSAIPPHIDGNEVNPTHKHHLAIRQETRDYLLEHEPVGYRFQIAGTRDKMYMCAEHDYTRDMSWQNKTQCYLPEDTDSFVLRNQDQPHGVDEDVEPRLVGFILGKPNAQRHNQLLEKSINKYSEHVIRKQDVFNA